MNAVGVVAKTQPSCSGVIPTLPKYLALEKDLVTQAAAITCMSPDQWKAAMGLSPSDPGSEHSHIGNEDNARRLEVALQYMVEQTGADDWRYVGKDNARLGYISHSREQLAQSLVESRGWLVASACHPGKEEFGYG